MTQTNSRKYIPLLLFIIGGMLIGGVGTYAFTTRNQTAASDDPAGQANADIAASGMSAKERKAIEAVVRAYILEYPDIITEAVGVLQSREMAKRLNAVGDALLKPFADNPAGNPSGDVTVVEFSDYNCGYCRASAADVKRLVDADKGIKLVYREVPILAPSSRDAAVWALAAAKQGKHDAFHNAMFAAGPVNDQNIRKVAASIGMDVTAAEKFAASAEASAEIENNQKMMQAIGFNGTPTFIIGDQILQGQQSIDALKSAIAKARKAA
jgi:protein-disulfide isomerase